MPIMPLRRHSAAKYASSPSRSASFSPVETMFLGSSILGSRSTIPIASLCGALREYVDTESGHRRCRARTQEVTRSSAARADEDAARRRRGLLECLRIREGDHTLHSCDELISEGLKGPYANPGRFGPGRASSQ